MACASNWNLRLVEHELHHQITIPTMHSSQCLRIHIISSTPPDPKSPLSRTAPGKQRVQVLVQLEQRFASCDATQRVIERFPAAEKEVRPDMGTLR